MNRKVVWLPTQQTHCGYEHSTNRNKVGEIGFVDSHEERQKISITVSYVES